MKKEIDSASIEEYLGKAIEDATEEEINQHDPKAGSIESYVMGCYNRAENAKRPDELRMLQAYRNIRGIYGPEVQFSKAEKSRVFVKITKTKVIAAYGKITDILFGNNKFPLSIDPTTLPDGVEETVSLETDPNIQQVATQQLSDEDRQLLPGETAIDQKIRLGALTKKLKPVEGKLVKGAGLTPTSVSFHPAEISAKKMQKKIYDQLEECNANKELRSTAFECAAFGTGIMKGPFVVDKEYPDWDEEGNYTPLIKSVPQIKTVSVWNFYPDPDATCMDDSEYVCERHKLSKSKLRALKNRPHFRDNAIENAIERGPNYIRENWEQTMSDNNTYPVSDRWSVIEFWGNIDVELLEKHGIAIPDSMKDQYQVSANIWVCNGVLLRCVLNPFVPTNIPYYAVPYEVNPYSFFGIGVAENMDDTQTLMNGFLRMAVDNAALSGNLVFEVDETNLVPGQNMTDIHPGKVFRRQGGAPGQAIFGTQFPNVANQNLQLFDKARQLADESTGITSYSHGQTGVQGLGRTAAGISMLMSASSGNDRIVVKNFDDYLLYPMGKAFFHFNMQFDFDPEIKGDLEVKALGTESLMADEVRSQRLMQFLGIIQNPNLAPFAKMDYIIREIAKSLDLDPDKVTNSMSDAAIQAEILKKFQPQQPEIAPGTPGEAAPAGIQAQDTQGTGDGTIGTGAASTPGEEGFTANTGGG